MSETHEQLETPKELVDNFENESSLQNWEQDRLVPSGVEFVDAPDREGERAIKLTVNRGDFARPKDNPTRERCELGELQKDFVPRGKEVSYELSFYVPEDFYVADNRLVIMQLRTNSTPKKENPPIALRYINGDLFMTLKSNDEWIELFRVNRDDFKKGAWHEMKIEYQQNDTHSGYVRAELDGKEVGKYEGYFGYDHLETDMHFRFGLYRDRFPDTGPDHPQSLLFGRFKRSVKP